MTSHRRSQFHRSVVAGLAVAALASPAAQASPALEPGSGDTGLTTEPVTADSPAITTTVDEGFDWGSAAIGAGGAAAVLLLSAAGASTLSPRRHRIGTTR